MNGKFEEKLAQLAFGDVSLEEAARIEAQVRQDPEAARLLAEFREMRGGLRDLAEVPEHQLSNERLREAILSQGLRPQQVPEPQKSRGLGAGWVWMPVATCALAFGLMTFRNQPKSEPMVVMKDFPASTSGGGTLQPPTPSFESMNPPTMRVSSTSGEKKSPTSAPTMTVAKRTSNWEDEPPKPLARNRRRSRFTSDSPTLPTPNWKADEDVEDPSQQGALAMRDASAAKPATNSTDMAASSAASGPIVLIDSNPDAMTGAPTATEVGNTSNVVVGG